MTKKQYIRPQMSVTLMDSENLMQIAISSTLKGGQDDMGTQEKDGIDFWEE